MKLTTVLKALEAQLKEPGPDDLELQQAIDELRAVQSQMTHDGFDNTDDGILAIPSLSWIDVMNQLSYDDYGKATKLSTVDITALDFYTQVRSTSDAYSGVPNRYLTDGYHFIAELWNDNENGGYNNPDGTFDSVGEFNPYADCRHDRLWEVNDASDNNTWKLVCMDCGHTHSDYRNLFQHYWKCGATDVIYRSGSGVDENNTAWSPRAEAVFTRMTGGAR